MSKRNSTASNTLFNYFAKSPATPKSDSQASTSKAAASSPLSSKSRTPLSKTPLTKKSIDFGESSKEKESKKAKLADSEDDEEDDVKISGKRKRSRIMRMDDTDDSDRENESSNGNSQHAMEVDDDDDAKVTKVTKKSSAPLHIDSPAAKKKKVDEGASTSNGKMSFEDKLKANIDESRSLSDVKEKEDDTAIIDEPTVWPHNTLDFLKPENIRDAEKRRPDHPEYDPSTLFVPTKYLDSLTPCVRQYWIIKSKNFDTVIFNKVGKFYELYHLDADVGVKELGFSYMKGDFAHSGFPEQSFDRMANSLIERGYKVARVEQTETPAMMEERVKKMHKPTKFDKVVNREVCQIVSKGTQVFGQQIEISNEYQPNYMLAIAEQATPSGHRFGIAFIDTSIGEFKLGEFDDDKQCSRLLTLLAHYPPVLVLNERGKLSLRLQQIFKSMLSHSLREQLLPDTQFLTAEKTLQTLFEKYYNTGDEVQWPEVLKITQDINDHLGLTPNPSYRLTLKALGACLWFLTKCIIDEQIMAMARFSLYIPPDVPALDIDELVASVAKTSFNKHMVLDSITLSNLKIVGDEKSLFSTLDNCCTKFGKRLLNYWVCSPSCERSVIVERQDAVKELMENPDILQDVRMMLGALPDLERQLAQCHTFGNKNRSENHPDGRAILFEQKKYNKKKIHDLVSTINGFDTLAKIPKMFGSFSSKLIKRLTQIDGGEFPNFEKTVEFFKKSFNFEEALEKGVIAPAKGVDTEYDATLERIEEINRKSQDFLNQQKKHFNCVVKYVGKDKNRFEIEVPESNAKKATADHILAGQKKGFRRFTTDETREFLKDMLVAEEQRDVVLKDLLRRMFERFSDKYKLWKQCVDCVSILDCLTALSVYGQNQNQFCFPHILDVEKVAEPIIEIEEGYHPCMTLTDDFIPNGITLGGSNSAPLAILTGPNMGGKSTLMRQVGLLVIMSQIGAPIPATSARISIIDRIFTRLGAQDDILAGQSTFLVELSETSTILKHATVNSLVLLDELGRGTATYDGTAIAAAVVDFLANLKCRTLFSTHYHNLVDHFHNDERISLGHMACMVENDGDTDDPTQETVTFLYKYTDGACPKSYGFNAAKLAGMKKSIIQRAYQYSKKVEMIALKRKLFAKVLTAADPSEVKEILLKMKKCSV